MSQLKKRHIKVYVGEIGNQKVFEAKQGLNPSTKSSYMRIDFEIKKYSNIYAYGLCTANIDLYNITDENSRSLMIKDNLVLVDAGWEGEEYRIFSGRVGTITRIKRNPDASDVITSLMCSSGNLIKNHYVYSNSIQKMEIKQFLRNLCAGIQVYDGNVKKNANVVAEFFNDVNNNKIQGTIINQTFDGDVINILQSLGSEFNFDFQITENKILFRPRQENPRLTIKPENGLIGIPEITELGVDLNIFLNANLETGDVFSLSSRFSNFKLGALNFIDRKQVGQNFNSREINENGRYEGTYKAISLIHKASSHTNDWQTEIEAMNYMLNKQTLRDQ
jgi:hypothetical protein